MPFNKEQLRAYWQVNKTLLNQKRRQKRKLAKLRLANSEEQVSHFELGKVNHQTEEVSQSYSQQVSHFFPSEVSHKLSQVSPSEGSHQLNSQVSHLKTSSLNWVSYHQPNLKTANPKLTCLIQKWLTSTNYSCASTCQTKYYANCWYFSENQLIDYKNLAS